MPACMKNEILPTGEGIHWRSYHSGNLLDRGEVLFVCSRLANDYGTITNPEYVVVGNILTARRLIDHWNAVQSEFTYLLVCEL